MDAMDLTARSHVCVVSEQPVIPSLVDVTVPHPAGQDRSVTGVSIQRIFRPRNGSPSAANFILLVGFLLLSVLRLFRFTADRRQTSHTH